MKQDASDFVLGIHPTSRGFGWALFEGPLSPFDWGTVEFRADKHNATIARIKKLLAQYEPEIIALEEFETGPSRRAHRIRRIAQAIAALAEGRGIEVVIYPRTSIRTAFASTRARTRGEIAYAIARHIEIFRHRLPPPQKLWVGEHPNISLFSAAACALTWYAENTV